MQTNNNCIVIFGASGDLTHRKLIPALYNLFKFGRLNKFSVLGVARSESVSYTHLLIKPIKPHWKPY